MPRKLTVFLSAPPGDGLRAARAYFQDYVKPVLVAAALDWEVIEGRREGDVRAGLAEKIRKLRTKNGETKSSHAEMSEEDKESLEEVLAQVRQKNGIEDWNGVQGDLVIGRNTWKEYIRGLHEGWLGPLDPPREPLPPPQQPLISESTPLEAPVVSDSVSSAPEPQSSDSNSPSSQPATSTPSPPKTTTPTPPYISPAQYPIRLLPSSLPANLPPSLPLSFPHVLGFLNTPTRVYRFLTRRHLADSTGREVAALVLAATCRPYHHEEGFASSVNVDDASLANTEERAVSDGMVVQTGHRWEQQRLLEEEEAEWHKSARKPRKDAAETVWIEGVVVDERIGRRMRRVEWGEREDGLGGLGDGETHDAEATSWLEGMKRWVGLGNRKHEPKGWEQGLVGEEGD